METTSIDFDLNEILLQIAILSAQLAECAGDCDLLVRERTMLLCLARERGLLLTDAFSAGDA